MNKSKKSIRTRLEKQAKSELKQAPSKKPQVSGKTDFLRLNWKDAVVFSLITVFGCGYWLQSGTLISIGS